MKIKSTVVSLVAVVALFTACGGGGGDTTSSSTSSGSSSGVITGNKPSFEIQSWSFDVVSGSRNVFQLGTSEPNTQDVNASGTPNFQQVLEYSIVDMTNDFSVKDKNRGVFVYKVPANASESVSIQVVAKRVGTDLVSEPTTVTLNPKDKASITVKKPYKVSSSEVSNNIDREFQRDINEELHILEVNTGLVWQDNEIQNTTKSYVDGVDSCTNGWRLPTYNELLNLTDYSKHPYSEDNPDPMIPAAFTTRDMINVWAQKDLGRKVYFNENSGMFFYPANPEAAKAAVRCVKGDGQGKHLIHSDIFKHTYDETTKLEWTKSLPSGTVCSQYSSDHLDSSNNPVPHTGFRVPTINELRSIVVDGWVPDYIAEGANSIVSSTPHVDIEDGFWILQLNLGGYGNMINIGASKPFGTERVVCVKDMN